MPLDLDKGSVSPIDDAEYRATQHQAGGPWQVLLVNPQSTPSPHKVFEPNIYPHIGLLTLATALEQAAARRGIAVEVLYYDGALLGDAFVRDYIAANAQKIALIGYSAVTLNYGSCVALASHAKACRPEIVNVVGNDHFSALYREVMSRRRGVFDYGFCGNDVVEGFTAFTLDALCGRRADPASYAGLVYRDAQAPGGVRCNPENPDEFERLPLIDYALLDSLAPHAERYHREQRQFYHYVREENLRITTIEIARGCLKFKGRRTEGGIPQNACDFCAIIPGSRALSAQKARRAWEIIRNAFESGYNYLFVTADELPSTFWPLIRDMVDEMPDWYRALPPGERPRMMGYARADAFRDRVRERIDVLMGTLGFDHFFVGLDGFTSLSLRAMNKGIQRLANDTDDLLDHNLVACREIAQRGGRLSAGAVITHMGITPALLETNFGMMRDIIRQYPRLFMELDFELLCPVPGSLAYDYLRRPGMARARADALGLAVDDRMLESLHVKYEGVDDPDPQELTRDFIRGCCPDITVELAHEYLQRIRALAEDSGIAYDCANIPASGVVQPVQRVIA